MFVGLSIDSLAASLIREWAEVAYEGQPMRLVDVGQMHSTLAFFPSVTDEKRIWMADLVRSIEWDAVGGTTGETILLGRGALALELVLPKAMAHHLDDRLVRTSDQPTWEAATAYHARMQSEPLGQLILAQEEPQLEHFRRARHNGRGITLHVTFARYRKGTAHAIPIKPMPPIAIQLSRVALYESYLGPNGSNYEIIAESP